MKGTVIAGGRVIDPEHGVDRETDVFVGAGRILALDTPPADFQETERVDARGLTVCPGLVDLAAHTREPGHAHVANIASEAYAAAAGGITTLCCTPDTDPVIDSPSVVELLRRRADEAGAARIEPLGALTRDLAGERLSELAALRGAGCHAFADGGRPLRDTLVLRRALEYAATFDFPVLLTPLDPWLAEGGLIHEGQVATRLGLPGISPAAETAALGRDLALIEQVGARVHFGRLSTAAGATALARAQRQGLPVTGDVAALQLFFTELDVWDFDTRYHVQPPLRAGTDREALRRALADGTLAVVCSDHQPHSADAKDAPLGASLPGASGVDTLLALMLRLVEESVLDLPTALAKVTCNPARILGLDAGTLAPGAPADICLFDAHAIWRVDAESLRSRGKNSPFLGWEFSGRVVRTWVGGRTVYGGD